MSIETIVAVCTARGSAPRGIVRLSGPNAHKLLEGLSSAPGTLVPGLNTLSLSVSPRMQFPAQVFLFISPSSFTGEDVVEFHLPGSESLLNLVVERFIQLGARAAGPGEFTQRAFLNGRLDLTEAEAVAELVAARSDAQLRAANVLRKGALAQRIGPLKDTLADSLALLEAGIDFSDEGIELICPAELARKIDSIQSALTGLLESGVAMERLSGLPTVVLAGRANVGKSLLMNRLTGFDRSLVSSISGTTRDVLSAPIRLEGSLAAGGEAMLIDAAGLEEDRHDVISRAAADAACRAIEGADLLLEVVDLTSPPAETAGLDRPAHLIVGNKRDLCSREQVDAWTRPVHRRGVEFIAVSALTGENLDELRRRIGQRIQGVETDASAAMPALNARHRQELSSAAHALTRARSLIPPAAVNVPDELIALELRTAGDHLGALVGSIYTDDLLERIFSRFCIGK